MAPSIREVVRFIGRSSKRIAVTVLGFAVVAGGLAMLVLPGPGILVVALGFAILGTEYAWAAAALEKTKRGAEKAGRVAKGAVRSASGRVRRRRPGEGPPPPRNPGDGPPTSVP
ncbi:MAG TPA: PGPGW domain-containing protein [Acidimicrobiia bacterium]|nr:PGPGW domain-containing protein [Acidimicrobiia bacterium]